MMGNQIVINLKEIFSKTERTSKYKQISLVNISHLSKQKNKESQEENIASLLSFIKLWLRIENEMQNIVIIEGIYSKLNN